MIRIDLDREKLVKELENLRQCVDELETLEAESWQAKGIKSKSVFRSLAEEGILCI